MSELSNRQTELAVEVLRRHFPGVNAMPNDAVTDLVAAWSTVFTSSRLWENFPTEAKFQENFGMFVRMLAPAGALGKVKVSAKIGKNYGGVIAEFGAEVMAYPGYEPVAFDNATAIVAAEHNRFQLERWAAGTSTPAVSSNQPARDIEVIIGERISVEKKGGKPYFKLHGGKYMKHGVRLWPEVAKAAGLTTMPETGLALKPNETTIELAGGQPKRVLKIEWLNNG